MRSTSPKTIGRGIVLGNVPSTENGSFWLLSHVRHELPEIVNPRVCHLDPLGSDIFVAFVVGVITSFLHRRPGFVVFEKRIFFLATAVFHEVMATIAGLTMDKRVDVDILDDAT